MPALSALNELKDRIALPVLSRTSRLYITGMLSAVSYVLSKAVGYTPAVVLMMVLSTVIAGLPIFRKAFSALRFKVVGIDALVTIAVAGALFIGEFWEAAAVTFLFQLGDYLESRTIEKTRASIRALLDLAPVTARVRRSDGEVTVSPEEVVPGDAVVIKPGERIPVDGTVLDGQAYVNQAAITGESVAVSRSAGEGVYSGAMLESGYLVVRADRVGDDTTFARILSLVEEAQDKKAKTQKFFERFSRYYTPGIIVLAAAVYLLTRDLVLALTLLVIACPGALVIATPVSIVAGIGNGARNGVLVKGGDIMEKLGTVRAVAFDKTGTLTVGRPTVRRVETFGIGEDELLHLAAIGETYSEHPLARAIVAEAASRFGGAVAERPDRAELVTGEGLRFSHDGRDLVIGKRSLLEQQGIRLDDVESLLQAEEDQGRTAVLVGDATAARVLGVISIADQLRPDAAHMIQSLRRQGVRRVVMLTGDNRRAAGAISAELGLDGFHAELLPEDKVRVLKELQGRYGRTAMVGDGVNDAPALASADLGIAIGSAGADVAMETADVVLLSAEVRRLSYAIGLSRATVRNLKQNIVFALLVAAFLLAGVLVKSVNLSFGMLVHELSVLLVIINAVRLLGFGRQGRNAPDSSSGGSGKPDGHEVAAAAP